jgi:outer membrane protein assembly factor BamB
MFNRLKEGIRMVMKFLRKFIIIFTILMVIGSSLIIITTIDSDPGLDLNQESIGSPEIIQQKPKPSTRGGQIPQLSVERTTYDWRMHLYGADHNSFTTSSGPTNASVLWYNSTGDTTYSSPCVADGRVFLGVGDSMKCYYENNGTLAWTMYPIQNVAGSFGVCSSPAYANGCIYFGADRIYCVWATNGSIRWKVDKPNIKHGDGTPTLAYGKVFIAGSDYKLYCIDQINGTVDWTFQAKSDYPPAIPDNWGLYAAPAVVNGSVYLAACDWYLYQINVSQATSVATANNTFKMGWASYSSPVVVNDKVYVGCSYMEKRSQSRFYCLWASNLTKIWEFYPNTHSGFFGSAGYYNGQLFIGSIDGALYCLNATSGSQIWNYTLGSSAQHDGTWSSPAVTAERFYIGSKDGYIYCFNTTQSGTPEYYWRYYISGEVDTSPSVVPGRVYIGTHGNGGRIYCFGTPDNKPPHVVSNYPGKGAINVPSTVEINITFNELINPSTLTASSFKLKDSGSNPVPGVITYDPVKKTAFFDPVSDLKRGENYTVTLTAVVQDYWMNGLDGNLNNISDGSPTDDFSWNFTTSSNNPPTLTNPGLTPTSGNGSTEFEFSIVYTDLDDDSPETDPSYIQVYIDDEIQGRAMVVNSSAQLNLRDGNYDNGEGYVYTTTFSTYGLHKYKFACFDGIDTIETLFFNGPTVLAEPVIEPIGELDAYEDLNLTLNLAGFLHDDDTDPAELSITTNSTYATVEDLNITFNYPNEFNYPSGRDYELVAINVSDSVHYVSRDVKINVHAINDPPSVVGVPDIQVKEDEYFYFNITQYLSDDDNEITDLIITENSSYANVSGRNITFYYPQDSDVVSEYVEINVSDGELSSIQVIFVTVVPYGAKFVLYPIPQQNAVEDIDLIIDIAGYIAPTSEINFQDLKLETSSNYCTISGTELEFNYPNEFNYPSGKTYELVQINATYLDQVESQNVRINVQAVNDGPIISVQKEPSSVLENRLIQFQVSYLDIDGSEEPIVSVIIGEEEFPMNLSSGDIHVEGAIFDLEISLRAGDYKYFYWADDGEFEINSVIRTQSYDLKVLEYSETGSDSDGDTMPDAWELQFELNPEDPTDAQTDADGDGYSNLEEFFGFDGVSGGNDSTNPLDSKDIPKKDKEDEVEDSDTSDNSMFVVGLVLTIIIVFIVILVVLFLVIKRNRKDLEFTGAESLEEYSPPEDEKTHDDVESVEE